MREISRFIYLQDFVHEGTVDKEAFMPPPNPRPYETSVILHRGESIDWTVGWRIGLDRSRPKMLVGSAEFDEVDASVSELEVVCAPSRISRNHANLMGWDEVDKMRRLAQAESIASRSEFAVAASIEHSSKTHDPC